MLKTGDQALDFELPNYQNKIVRLFDRLSHNAPLLIAFYKFNCPTCQYTFTHLPRIAREVGNEHFLAVAQDSLQEALDFKNRYGVDFEVLCDMKPYPVSKDYGLDFVPTFFIIEPDKKISLIAEGFDKKAIEDFAIRIATLKSVSGFHAFSPTDQVPLLKPG